MHRLPVHGAEVLDRAGEAHGAQSERREDELVQRLAEVGAGAGLDPLAGKQVAHVRVGPALPGQEFHAIGANAAQQLLASPGGLARRHGGLVLRQATIVRHARGVLQQLAERVRPVPQRLVERETALLGKAQRGRGDDRLGEAPPREDRVRVTLDPDDPVVGEDGRMNGNLDHPAMLARSDMARFDAVDDARSARYDDRPRLARGWRQRPSGDETECLSA